MSRRVAVSMVRWICETGERYYGLSHAELLDAAMLAEADLRDMNARVPAEASEDLLRYILERTGDEALGLRLAQHFELRKQGFWGYLVLSSLSVRQLIEIQQRYVALRLPTELRHWVEGDRAFVQNNPIQVPSDLQRIALDCAVAVVCCVHLPRWKSRPFELEVWLTQSERPHHRELRELVDGPIVFDAPSNLLSFPARDLALRLAGDAELARMLSEQLDESLARLRAQPGQLLEEVRELLGKRLAHDSSLERIARDLRLSTRTLRRQLSTLGTSFHELLEETRRARAIASLSETNEPVEQLAQQLGYGDAGGFRRAFRRWTGLSPAEYRTQQRAQTAQPATPKSPPSSQRT